MRSINLGIAESRVVNREELPSAMSYHTQLSGSFTRQYVQSVSSALYIVWFKSLFTSLPPRFQILEINSTISFYVIFFISTCSHMQGNKFNWNIWRIKNLQIFYNQCLNPMTTLIFCRFDIKAIRPPRLHWRLYLFYNPVKNSGVFMHVHWLEFRPGTGICKLLCCQITENN